MEFVNGVLIGVFKIARDVARDLKTYPFINLVELVGSGDLDTQIQSLRLINSLIQRPDGGAGDLISHFEIQLGLRMILKVIRRCS